MHTLTAKALLNGFPQDNIVSSSKVQWILSRLIIRQPILPLMDKYYIKGGGFPKDKSYIPSKWDHNVTPMIDKSVESISWMYKKIVKQPTMIIATILKILLLYPIEIIFVIVRKMIQRKLAIDMSQ
ncbi:PREDICTED: uncharacterized protein LOC105147395 [Acromyrmex echinatior]|uniref:uncharacterized protein LOC105147395 n=1 Tax=Acromyrmex echinatior TaxID=103372 RepID=UPI000580C11B|nr:PREDICTED: uncharacterized protein LOC105147395 [Acromyrmex echinatior]